MMSAWRYHLLVLVGLIWMIYNIEFNQEDVPYDPKLMLLQMDKELASFQPLLGKASLVNALKDSTEALSTYEFLNKNNVSPEEIRIAFMNFGWGPKMRQSRDGEYEVFCKEFLQARYYLKKKGLVRVILFYSRGTPCFDLEYLNYNQ